MGWTAASEGGNKRSGAHSRCQVLYQQHAGCVYVCAYTASIAPGLFTHHRAHRGSARKHARTNFLQLLRRFSAQVSCFLSAATWGKLKVNYLEIAPPEVRKPNLIPSYLMPGWG